MWRTVIKENLSALIILCIVWIVITVGAFYLYFFVAFFVAENARFTQSELKKLSNIDRIEISILKKQNDGVYHTRSIKTITDPKQIDLVVARSRSYADGWQHADFGAMSRLLGPIGVVFYRDSEIRANFEIGYVNNRNYYNEDKFYLRHYWGPGRWLNEQEFEELLDIIEVDKQSAHFDMD